MHIKYAFSYYYDDNDDHNVLRLMLIFLMFFCLRSQDLAYIHEVLKNVFLIFPNYCLGRGLMDIAFNEYRNEFFFKIGTFADCFLVFFLCIKYSYFFKVKRCLVLADILVFKTCEIQDSRHTAQPYLYLSASLLLNICCSTLFHCEQSSILSKR